MADPLAALGAASSIITFIEFSWKLFSTTKDVYQSATGQNEDNLVLEVVAKDITRLNESINCSSGLDSDLKALIKESRTVSDDLLKALDRLKTKGGARVWSSFHVALKDVWKKDQIEGFSRRLTRLQNQVTSHIQLRLSDQVSQISLQLKNIGDAYRDLGIDMHLELRDLKSLVINAAGKANTDPSKDKNVDPSKLPGLISGLLDDTPSATQGEDFERFLAGLEGLSETITKLLERGRSVKPTTRLLERLSFPMMMARETKIPQAHVNTYKWIFEPANQDATQPLYFTDWLREGNGTFWIHGKPGSGKSTLVKFIARHQATRDALNHWAGEARLLTASCFFWYAGSKMQKSQIGLLRSILYQLVVQYPTFTTQVTDTLDRHPGLDAHSHHWVNSVDDMLLVLKTLIMDNRDQKFCFFIDGLDEYEEEGMLPSDLVNVIWELVNQPHTKACIASRPWSVFIDAFATDEKHNITLEFLTRSDIRRYVDDSFNNNAALRNMHDSCTIHSKLSDEICRRAQGVFLWVHLVIRDLLHGLTQGDTIAVLADRLSRFPPDLERFFQHMIDTIDPIYTQHTARLLDVARSAPAPESMIVYSLMDDLVDDEDIWRRESVSPMSEDEISSRKDQMRRRLDGRCKGLLELVDEPGKRSYYKTKVEFIHRTVHEFLMSSEGVQELIRNNLDQNETPVVLCKAKLLLVKYSLFPDKNRLSEVLRWVRRAEQSAPGSLAELSEVLNAAKKQYLRYDGIMSFLECACELGISLVVEPYWALTCHPKSGELLYSAMNLENFLVKDDEFIQVHILRHLLQGCVSPNCPIGAVTPWERILGKLRNAPVMKNGTKRKQLFEAIQLLLKNGASLDARPPQRPSATGDHLDARETLRRIFPEEELALLVKAADEGRKSPMALKANGLRSWVNSLLTTPYRY